MPGRSASFKLRMAARDGDIVAAYLAGRTTSEIATQHGMTRERVGQVIRSAGHRSDRQSYPPGYVPEGVLIDAESKALIGEGRLSIFKGRRDYVRVVLFKSGFRRQTFARLIMGASDDQVVDHINGNTLDNRRCNLRLCSATENAKNRRKQSGASRFKGLTRCKGKWRAQIASGGKKHWLGRFDDEIEGARAYDAAAIRLHGDFAKLNFPNDRPVVPVVVANEGAA